MTADILASIIAYKREEVAAARAITSSGALSRGAQAASRPRGFHDALTRSARAGSVALIAEIKKASPSQGLIRKDFDPAALAKAYARGGAACLSVLTDRPSFMGADEDLATARDACTLPCLRKEFMVDPWQVTQSRALGADAILVILATTDDALAGELQAEAARMEMDVLFEVHDEAQVDRAIELGARLIGINNRDLATFVTDLSLTERLAPRIPGDVMVIAESGIASASDVRRIARAGARAMLVGESLMRSEDLEFATKALLDI